MFAGAELDEATENMRASLTQPEPTAQHGSEEVEAWICDGLPDAMIEAGCGAWDKARIEMQDREASDQPEAYTDWDDGMIVAAIYKAMAPFAALSAQQGGGEEGNDYPACPVCGAPAGMDCRTVQGRIPPHPERVSAQQAAGEAVAWRVDDLTYKGQPCGSFTFFADYERADQYAEKNGRRFTKITPLYEAGQCRGGPTFMDGTVARCDLCGSEANAAPQPEAPAEVQQEVAGDIRREIMDRTRNMMGMLADLREAVDLDDESASEVLGYCDDLETAVHNIGAVASHLATPQQGQEVEG